MWEFSRAVDGISEACRVLETPVVSGNVSFYNETQGEGIYPTPTIGMVGLLEDVDRRLSPHFQREGDAVLLLGETKGHLGGSAYLWILHGLEADPPPPLDLLRERSLHGLLRDLAGGGLLRSAHDCSDGGLLVAAAECCLGRRSDLGAELDLPGGGLTLPGLLFGEDASRVVATADPADVGEVLRRAAKAGVPARVIGRTGGGSLRVRVDGAGVLDLPLRRIRSVWEKGFEAVVGGGV